MPHPMNDVLLQLREKVRAVSARTLETMPQSKPENELLIWAILEIDTSLQAILDELGTISARLDRIADGGGV